MVTHSTFFIELKDYKINSIETLFHNFHDAILILNAVYVSRKKEQKDCGIKSDENVAVFFLMKKEIKLFIHRYSFPLPQRPIFPYEVKRCFDSSICPSKFFVPSATPGP